MTGRDNKRWGLFFIIFAVLYFIFTVFIVKHGIHFINSIITIGLLIAGVYFYSKDRLIKMR